MLAETKSLNLNSQR